MARQQYPHLQATLNRLAPLFVFVFLMIAVASCGMTTSIGAGESGVRFNYFSGTDMEDTYGEGLKVHAPWVNVVRYNTRIQEQTETVDVLSNNGLTIGMEVSIRYRPEVEANALPDLHQTYGQEYYTKLIQPELRSAIREVVSQFTPEELYSSRRTELQGNIFEQMVNAVDGEYVRVETVLIRNIELPQQIRLAIENKLTEEQEAQRYEFTLQKEELEAQRKEIEAAGQAEYQRIISSNLSQQFLRFKGIEATQQLAESDNAKVVIVGGEGSGGLPIILGGQ